MSWILKMLGSIVALAFTKILQFRDHFKKKKDYSNNLLVYTAS
jgi:hypothetical protein